ncbi:MAG: N-acetylmuramoyl-L-alanine amidase, partial [Eggerthellaceae bacterium]|nr:N-acetylmuramoyl-L-alanine amidase [Eggerthellaceae bacterium]
KDAAHTRWIVLHDTADTGDAAHVVRWWAGNGKLVASHFIIDRDGTITQCVPLDKIAHHAGYGDAGADEAFGVSEDGRDDMRGSVPLRGYPDYGMNAWSVGIELVHEAGQQGGYPEAQLTALDNLIAYIDEWCGFECPITIHREWRTSNVDTSAEFNPYLDNYRDHRTHDDVLMLEP